MGTLGTPSIVVPEDQSVTFVELFFDLVFVFSVTQVASLLHHHLDWTGLGQAVLVFWLVWWGWTQFTWALNAADTTHTAVELATLLATGVAFFMAVAVQRSFSGGAIWFALPCVFVRLLGLGLYVRVTWAADPSQHAAVRRFAFMSVFGLAAVMAGAIAGGNTIYWLWGLAILLDIVAAMVAGGAEAGNLHPDHFGERHGLFVIRALGESLIVAGGGLASVEIDLNVIAVGALTVATTCALWWSYFGSAKLQLDRALEGASGAALSSMGRDVYSLLHYPMMLGVIGVAVAIEEIVLQPAEPLDLANRLTLALGVALFTGGMSMSLWRATGSLPAMRLSLAGLTAVAVVVAGGVLPVLSLTIAFGGVAILAALEHLAPLPRASLEL